MLTLALGLAWLTQQSVRDQSVLQYLLAEWPSPRLWRAALRDLGYAPLLDPKISQRILQSFIPDFAVEPAIHISEDGCLIYLETLQAGERRPELWACAARPDRPRHWDRLGTGWYAFQRLPPTPKTRPKPSKKLSNPIDPLEIRY